MEQITLYFKNGGSDKVYQASIEPTKDGYLVNFAYGRRGSTMQTGTKTATAVNLEAARGIYERLVKEKMAKRWVIVCMSSTFSAGTDRTSGVVLIWSAISC